MHALDRHYGRCAYATGRDQGKCTCISKSSQPKICKEISHAKQRRTRLDDSPLIQTTILAGYQSYQKNTFELRHSWKADQLGNELKSPGKLQSTLLLEKCVGLFTASVI